MDEIVDALAELPEVAACYAEWNKLKDELTGYYRQQPREHRPLSQQEEFRAIKNMVIREAENLRVGAVTFEDEDTLEPDGEPETDPFNLNAREGALRQSAEAGNDYAQYAFAALLQELGRMGDAVPWLERAAGNGNQFAQYRLAKLHLTGDGVPRDTVRAAELLEASANRGNQWAQYLLGKLLLQGKQMERDRDAAAEWLKRSADQGNIYAQFLLERVDDRRDPSLLLSVTRLLHHMGNVFRDMPPPTHPLGARIDSKRRRKILQKRLALGHKIDDHEDELNNKYQHTTHQM